MGSAKREMERGDDQQRVAIGLLLETDAFGKCDDHDEVYDALGGHEDAVELGKERFAAGAPGYDVFDSEDEVEQAVERAKNNHGTSCGLCDRRDDD